MAKHRVRALLMDGRACVLYGAVELTIGKKPDELALAIEAEERLERDHDRIYWQPLKAELERLRHKR